MKISCALQWLVPCKKVNHCVFLAGGRGERRRMRRTARSSTTPSSWSSSTVLSTWPSSGICSIHSIFQHFLVFFSAASNFGMDKYKQAFSLDIKLLNFPSRLLAVWEEGGKKLIDVIFAYISSAPLAFPFLTARSLFRNRWGIYLHFSSILYFKFSNSS